MIEVIYASAGCQPFSTRDLTDLLAKARTNNQASGVTGILLYHRGSFLQVLEGEESIVSSLYEKIAKDPRHNRCIVIKRSTVTERGFADWSMGFAEVSTAVANKLDGFNSFLLQGHLAVKAHAKQIEQILGGFRAGRWRQHIS